MFFFRLSRKRFFDFVFFSCFCLLLFVALSGAKVVVDGDVAASVVKRAFVARKTDDRKTSDGGKVE